VANFAEALNHARGCLSTGRATEAAGVYQQLLKAAPQMPDLWHEMGIAQLQAGYPRVACQYLERAAQLAPSNAAFLANLGAAYQKNLQPQQAVEAFQKAMQAGARTPQIYSNLGLALRDAGRADEALTAFDQALALQPDYATGHFNRANLLLQQGRSDEAMAGFRRAIDIDPRDAGSHCLLGIAHFDRGEMTTAISCFDRALAVQPQYAEALRNRGMARLALGDFERGWVDWEYRTTADGFVPRVTDGPRWNGEPLAGRTLLVHAEQGLGDTLQFIRYVPLLEKFGGRVSVEVQPALIPLLTHSGFGQWLAPPGKRPAFDVHCPLMSLARYLPDPSGRPYWSSPYLRADASRAAHWRQTLQQVDGVRVGIVWTGNVEHPLNRLRSLTVEQLAPLAGVPGVHLLSLQKGPSEEQSSESLRQHAILTIDEPWDADGAFVDTAAIIEQLDLVITVDTSIAHLAGGLGRPAWVLLQHAPDWRWQLSGETTVWYPTLRLFRQPSPGDWSPVIERVWAELAYRQAPSK
jgi:Flp pilus assembly protein TadD